MSIGKGSGSFGRLEKDIMLTVDDLEHAKAKSKVFYNSVKNISELSLPEYYSSLLDSDSAPDRYLPLQRLLETSRKDSPASIFAHCKGVDIANEMRGSVSPCKGTFLFSEIHIHRNNPIIKITPELKAIIEDCSVSPRISANSLKAPFPDGSYVHFGQEGVRSLNISDKDSPDGKAYNVEGVFIHYSDPAEGEALYGKFTLGFLFVARAVNGYNQGFVENSYVYPVTVPILDENTPVIKLCQYGAVDAFDTLFYDINAEILESKEDAGWLNKITSYFKKETGKNVFLSFDEESKKHLHIRLQLLQYAVKFMLYFSSRSARVSVHDAYDKEVERGRGKKGIAKAKHKNKLASTFNYILVGPSEDDISRSGENGGKVTPHIRRGHFRDQRYGQQLAKTKVLYIDETFVGSAVDLKAKRKPYFVK